MTLRVVPRESAAVFGDPVSACIDGSGVNQQNRDIVLDWIDAAAFTAFQARRILSQDERLLTSRAYQNVKQILRNHDERF